jgi:putative SOS response-associated peptidase YedK
MCGRMTLASDDIDEVAREIEAIYDASLRPSHRARYNIAPTDPHLIVRHEGGQRRLERASWGFVRPHRPPLFNARSETAALRDSFRDSFAGRRCIVPADGFYEWSGPKNDRRPYWLHRRDGRLLLLAGIFEDDGATRRFCVLTTNPNAVVARLHDRMPVILRPDDVDAWLENGSPTLLEAAPDDVLVAVPVSARVNSVKNDDPACRAPAAPEVPAQLRLSGF